MRVGFCWGGLTVTLALACGARSTKRPDVVLPESAEPTTEGKSGGASAGAASSQPPRPEMGGTGGAAAGAGGEAPLAGAGPTEWCAGVAALCAPGEPLCDPKLGVTATCDECGVPRPDESGAPCARLIASDKESNLVCVVRGATELRCWPEWSGTKAGVVPAETLEVLLRDDSAAAENNLNRPCTRTGTTEYSCWSSSACSHVTVGDDGVCAICNGELACKGNVTLPTFSAGPLIDITITDNAVFALSAAGVTTENRPPQLPELWKGSPHELQVDHQMGGCLVSTADEVACWIPSPTQPLRPSAWTGLRKLVPMTLPIACMLDTEGRVGCGDVFVGVAPPLFDVANVVDVVGSSSLACALTREGRVHCWDRDGAAVELPPDW